MSWDEYASPRVRRVIVWAYGLTFLSGGLLFLVSEAGSSSLLLVPLAIVFLPAFAVSWVTTLYAFYDMTLGSYLRFRRMRRERRRER